MKFWTFLALASLVACADWTAPVRGPSTSDVIRISDDAKPCFDVRYVDASQAERELLSSALSLACHQLRDRKLVAFLFANIGLLKAEDRRGFAETDGSTETRLQRLTNILEPTADLRGPAGGDVPLFYIVAASCGRPGISEICVKKEPTVRATRINRNERLRGPEDLASLANTLAHESLHLHASARCTYSFTDDGRDWPLKCNSMSYVVGNAVQCNIERRGADWTDSQWQACMTPLASSTPGHQEAAARNVFGCDPVR